MKSNTSTGVTASGLRKAAVVMERIEKKKAALAQDEQLLQSLIGSNAQFTSAVSPSSAKAGSSGAKRTMSPATKAKIAAGQAARWAAKKAAAGTTPAPAAQASAPQS